MRDNPLHPGDTVHVPATFTDQDTGKTIESTVPAKVVMARVPGKTLVNFGKTIQTVSNENIKEVKDA